MDEDDEDPRAQRLNICGVTRIGSTGIEWICISEVHDVVYPTKKGGHKPSSNPQVDRHHWVNRWPNRNREEDDHGSQLVPASADGSGQAGPWQDPLW